VHTQAHAAQALTGVPSGGEAVSVTSLSKRYGSLMAVNDVSFSLPVGSVTGFLGPNGAGKTTTLKLLLALAEPSAGEALIFGRRYRDVDLPTQLVGAVLESGDFDLGRSGRNHLRVLALASEVREARVDEMLDVVGLTAAAKQPVGTYSLGMRQRLGLAGALLGNPRVLVLDEPANGLDASGVHWLRRFLRSFAETGGTVLMSSHDLSEIAQTADRIVIMNRGRIVFNDPIDQLTTGRDSLEEAYLELIEESVS